MLKELSFLIIFILALFASAKAQNNSHNLVKDHIEYNTLFATPTYDTSYYTQTLLMEGETIINGNSYMKLYRKYSSLFNLEFELIGYMREVAEKVFYRPIEQEEDFLLYDFSLNIGDSTYMYWNQYDWGGLYVRVDSITFEHIAGFDRKCYHISSRDDGHQNWAQYNTWIEGIGAKEGLLNTCQHQQVGGHPSCELLCYKEDGKTLYMNEKYNTCLIDSQLSVIENNKDNSVMFFDHTSSTLYITNDTNSQVSLSVINAQGKEVFSNKVFYGNNANLSFLKSGIYIAVLYYENAVSYLKFFCKKLIFYE